MSSLAFASAPTLFAEGGERPGAEAKRASAKARGEAYVQGARATKPEDSSSSSHELKYGHGAFPGVLWAEDWRISFGSVRSICVSAWLIFLLMPILFFTLAMPTLQPQLPYDLTTFGLVLFVLTALFFLLTGCVNPGVPAMPHVTTDGSGGGGGGGAQAGQVPHPGEQYSLSRDTNRYVRGFDHFCEFVGNDIGKGNLPCFVTFLVLLSALSTYVVVLSAWLVADHLMPPLVEWHWLTDVWRIGLASAIVAILGWALYKCGASEVCAGVLPLIMMMPGATVGAVLILLVLFATIVMPLTTDMFATFTPENNPVAFFLILPALCFAVLFWGMSAHWVHLLCDGLTQKMWLRAKGYRRPRKPSEPELV